MRWRSATRVVGVDGGLRVWIWSDTSKRWYEDRFRPTLEPLTQLDIDRVLVTHGPPVMRDGARELEGARRRSLVSEETLSGDAERARGVGQARDALVDLLGVTPE